MTEESDIDKLWNAALEGLNPKIQDALNQFSRGEITKDEFDKINREVNQPTKREEVLGRATEATFQQFMRGDISKDQLDKYVDTLNNNPDSILPGKS